MMFKNLGKSNTHHASRVIGMFKANFAPLSVHIWVKSGRPSKPVKESILRALRQDPDLNEVEHNAIDLMTYAGERVQALARTPLEDVSFIEGSEVAIITITPDRSKTATGHPCAIPSELAERLLEQAKALGWATLYRNYEWMWKRITKIAKDKYGEHITSHFFRKRYESIAERYRRTR